VASGSVTPAPAKSGGRGRGRSPKEQPTASLANASVGTGFIPFYPNYSSLNSGARFFQNILFRITKD